MGNAGYCRPSIKRSLPPPPVGRGRFFRWPNTSQGNCRGRHELRQHLPKTTDRKREKRLFPPAHVEINGLWSENFPN